MSNSARHPLAQVLVELARDLGLAVLVDERQHGDLHRREPRVETQQRRARGSSDLLLVVGVDEERERGAVGARRRLDHVRDEALAAARVNELELLA